MQTFWTENLALICIRVPSGAFQVTFLVVLTAASSSQPLRKNYLPDCQLPDKAALAWPHTLLPALVLLTCKVQ